MNQYKIRINKRAPSRQMQAGETLIEVLITIALVAFSLLGIARLALSATQAQQDGLSKVNTNAIYSDTVNRISANRGEADASLTSNSSGYNFNATWDVQASAIASPTTDCTSASCTSAQRSAFDLYEIRQAARTLLPQGSVTLTGDSTAGMALSLYWIDKNFLNTSISPPVPGTSPTCGTGTGSLTVNSCCPAAASVPKKKGIRCVNYYFIP